MYNPFKDFLNLLNEAIGYAPLYPKPKRRQPRNTQTHWVIPAQLKPKPVPRKKPEQKTSELNRAIEEQWAGFLFHGTKNENNAENIMRTHKWVVNVTTNKGVYLTPSFKTAKEYAQGKGYIVVVHVKPTKKIVHLKSDYYYAPVPQNFREGRIEGLTPIAVINKKGERLF